MEEPERGSELRRHYLLAHPLLMKPNDATGELGIMERWNARTLERWNAGTAGTLLHTKATKVRKLYDDVVERLLTTNLIEQKCELRGIEQEVRIRKEEPPVWVRVWDAKDPYRDDEIPPAFMQDDTNLYFVVG